MTVVSADTRPLTWRLQHGDAITDIKTYESLEGYAAVRKAIKGMSPQDVQKIVKDANLRGRGGAGFADAAVIAQDAGGATNIAWRILYSDTAANKQCIGYQELSTAGTISLVAGSLTLTESASGVLRMTQS